MKKISILLLCALGATACIDAEFDLSKVDTDNIAIGDNESQFEVPLLKVFVGMDELNGTNGEIIDELFAEADTWLPSQLPDQDGNGYFVQIPQLAENGEYVDGLIEDLIAQMVVDPVKLNQMATLLQEKYYDEFSSLLPSTPQEEFKTVFVEQYTVNEELRRKFDEKISELAFKYLTGLEVSLSGLTYEVERIDISDDVVDMLTDNLDSEEVADPKNTLHMSGTVDNRLPISITASALFAPTDVSFTATIEANCEAGELPETRLFAEDLLTIVRGLTIEIAVGLDKYYPGKGFDRGSDEEIQPQLTINLHLIKRGALKFDL